MYDETICKSTAIEHDRLFKELFRVFFLEFVEIFFPKLYKIMDKTHVRFLVQETFHDLTKGEKNIADIVVETKLAGMDGFVLVHVEHQAQRQKSFNDRMFRYFYRFYDRHNKIIIPIAVFSHDSTIREPDKFILRSPIKSIVEFSYDVLQLKTKNWRSYINSNNPAAAALMTRMNYRKKEAIKVKVAIARMIARMQLDQAKSALITIFSDTYIPLDEDKRLEFHNILYKEMNQLEVEKYMEYTTYYHTQGWIKGRDEGKAEGKAEMVAYSFKKKFGFEPRDLKENLLKLSPEMLDDLNYSLLTTNDAQHFLQIVEKELVKNQLS
jgi:hypothetical protein